MASQMKIFNVKDASLYQELIRVHGIGRSTANNICKHFNALFLAAKLLFEAVYPLLDRLFTRSVTGVTVFFLFLSETQQYSFIR